MLKIFRTKKGITLIEVMLVMAIIGILSTSMLVIYRKSVNEKKLKEATRILESAIRLAQNYALTGQQMDNATVTCGFGIHKQGGDVKKFKIFYNEYNPSGNNDCGVALKKFNNAASKTVNEYEFEDPIKITGNGQVYFTMPHGRVFDKNGNSVNSSASPLEISVKGYGNNKRIICVYGTGVIKSNKGSSC